MGDKNIGIGNMDYPEIPIMLFGLSGSGKTNFLASLLRQMYENSINKNGVSYSLEVTDNSELVLESSKVNAWFKLRDGFVTESTQAGSDFPFMLRIMNDKESYKWPIELRDYAGGDISVSNKVEENDIEAIEKYRIEQEKLEKAEIIFVVIDAIRLALYCEKYKSNVNMCVEKMDADSVNSTLPNIFNKKGNKGGNVTVLFLLTKTDASIFNDERFVEYKANNFSKLREMVKNIYQKVFDGAKYQVNKNYWDFGIVPVCVCGEGNVSTSVENKASDGEKNDLRIENTIADCGVVEPRGIDTAFMYSIRCTFRSKISVLERELKRYQDDIDQGKDFIRLDEHDNVVWRCNSKLRAYLIDKEKAVDYQARITSALTGIENKKRILEQMKIMTQMKNLIDIGYKDEFKHCVFDKDGPVAGVVSLSRPIR